MRSFACVCLLVERVTSIHCLSWCFVRIALLGSILRQYTCHLATSIDRIRFKISLFRLRMAVVARSINFDKRGSKTAIRRKSEKFGLLVWRQSRNAPMLQGGDDQRLVRSRRRSHQDLPAARHQGFAALGNCMKEGTA